MSEQMANTIGLVQAQAEIVKYEMHRDQLLEAEGLADVPDGAKYADAAAWGFADEEIREHGRMVSSPKAIARKAVDSLSDLGRRRASQAREETGPEEQRSTSSDEQGGLTNEAYADLFRSHTAKIRSRR